MGRGPLNTLDRWGVVHGQGPGQGVGRADLGRNTCAQGLANGAEALHVGSLPGRGDALVKRHRAETCCVRASPDPAMSGDVSLEARSSPSSSPKRGDSCSLRILIFRLRIMFHFKKY